mgnify:CR=1 FL=1
MRIFPNSQSPRNTSWMFLQMIFGECWNRSARHRIRWLWLNITNVMHTASSMSTLFWGFCGTYPPLTRMSHKRMKESTVILQFSSTLAGWPSITSCTYARPLSMLFLHGRGNIYPARRSDTGLNRITIAHWMSSQSSSSSSALFEDDPQVFQLLSILLFWPPMKHSTQWIQIKL